MYTEDQTRGLFHWGTVVWVLSGAHLLSMAIHDFYFWYLSYRQGIEIDVERWSLPWLSPSTVVLQRFGAFLPYRAIVYGQWWRMLTSVFMSTSVMEWLLVIWSWRALRWGGARPTRKWCYVYLLSVFTGQIWMMAFDLSGVAGAAAWGSSGVICAAGGAKPRQRFLLFMTAIAMVVVSLLEPTNSVMGTIGGSFFGWAYYGLGWSRVVSKMDKGTVKPKGMTRLLSGLALLKLWVVPLLFVAFREPIDPAILSRHQWRVLSTIVNDGFTIWLNLSRRPLCRGIAQAFFRLESVVRLLTSWRLASDHNHVERLHFQLGTIRRMRMRL